MGGAWEAPAWVFRGTGLSGWELRPGRLAIMGSQDRQPGPRRICPAGTVTVNGGASPGSLDVPTRWRGARSARPNDGSSIPDPAADAPQKPAHHDNIGHAGQEAQSRERGIL
jgi:hypothetical protein